MGNLAVVAVMVGLSLQDEWDAQRLRTIFRRKGLWRGEAQEARFLGEARQHEAYRPLPSVGVLHARRHALSDDGAQRNGAAMPRLPRTDADEVRRHRARPVGLSARGVQQRDSRRAQLATHLRKHVRERRRRYALPERHASGVGGRGKAVARETRRRRRRRSLPAAGLRSHRQPQLQSRLVRMTAALGDTVAVILIVFALAMAAIVVWRIVARGNPRIRRIRLGVFYERETDELGELTPDERYERLPR